MNRPTHRTPSTPSTPVASVIPHRRLAVPPHAPIKQVAQLLVQTGAAAAPVVSATGVLVGTVSALDIVRAQERGPWSGRHTAAEVMARYPVTIEADAPLDRAARLLADRRTAHLVVVDRAGAVVGVVDRRDLLDPLCRPDREIHADVVAAIDTLVPMNGGTIRVDVLDGIVHLTGDLAGQSDGRAVRQAVHDVPGVIDVRDDVLHPDTATSGRYR